MACLVTRGMGLRGLRFVCADYFAMSEMLIDIPGLEPIPEIASQEGSFDGHLRPRFQARTSDEKIQYGNRHGLPEGWETLRVGD